MTFIEGRICLLYARNEILRFFESPTSSLTRYQCQANHPRRRASPSPRRLNPAAVPGAPRSLAGAGSPALPDIPTTLASPSPFGSKVTSAGRHMPAEGLMSRACLITHRAVILRELVLNEVKDLATEESTLGTAETRCSASISLSE